MSDLCARVVLPRQRKVQNVHSNQPYQDRRPICLCCHFTTLPYLQGNHLYWNCSRKVVPLQSRCKGSGRPNRLWCRCAWAFHHRHLQSMLGLPLWLWRIMSDPYGKVYLWITNHNLQALNNFGHDLSYAVHRLHSLTATKKPTHAK